jgi:hypothetical protein
MPTACHWVLHEAADEVSFDEFLQAYFAQTL